MNVVAELLDDIAVIRVSGEVDLSNTSLIEQAVDANVTNQAHALIVDLSDATYLDSSGVRLLYHLDSRLGSHQQRLVVIVPAGAPILRTLQAAGVIGSVALASTQDAAMLIARSAFEPGSVSNG